MRTEAVPTPQPNPLAALELAHDLKPVKRTRAGVSFSLGEKAGMRASFN